MFKRDCKLFLRCLAVASLLMIILASVCALAAGSAIMSSGEVFTPVKIALIDYEDSVISRILIGMVKNSDYIKNVLSAENMEEDEAMDALQNGECAAVIVLPDGFLDNILYGRESEAVIYLTENSASQAFVVEAVAKFGEHLIFTGQAGVFAGENVIREFNLGSDVQEKYNSESNMKLMEEALVSNRRYFRVEVIDFLDIGMSTTSFTVLCWLVMLLLMLSLFFAPMYRRDTTCEMLRRLRVLGVGNLRYMKWKILLPVLLRLAVVLPALYLLGDYLGTSWSFGGILSAIVAVCFITLIGTAITMCLGDGITANVIFGIGGMFLSGGLIPRQLLPDTVRFIGDLTPFGAAMNLMKPAFGAQMSVHSSIAAVIYSVCAVILIRHTLQRTVRGGAPR